MARYINDNLDESKLNCKFVKLAKEARADVVALRDVGAGEELYAAYGNVYWKNRKKS